MQNSERSRRSVLSGLAAAGTAGAFVGTGTTAVFSDEEQVSDGLLESGGIDLLVEWESGDRSGSSEGEASFPIAFSGPDPDRTGDASFSVSLPESDGNNPAYGWFRLSCPDPTDLADALDVTLRYDCDGEDVLASGSLLEVADTLRNGAVLSPDCEAGAEPGSQACLQPGEPVDLALEWELDEDYAGTESASVTLEFVGRQCRNRDGTTRPFPTVPSCEDDTGGSEGSRHGISYVGIYADPDGDGCTFVGKLELEDDYCGQGAIAENHIEPARRYEVFGDGDGCQDTEYDVHVTETHTKTEDGSTETVGIAFELREGQRVGPDLCRVEIKGSSAVTYDDGDFDGNATDGVLWGPEK